MPPNQISNDQIKLFRSLFHGRDDVYGTISNNSPVCVRKPLTDGVILKHLTGTDRIGRYPILKDGRVPWAVVDIDELNREKVERVVAAFILHNLYPYVELSRGKGYHVWLFFDDPVPANAVRKVLKKLLREAEIDGYELFPKQDGLSSNNGVGNFVFFPLHGQSIKEKKTVFLNGEFQEYENPWEHLARIHRTKSENLLSMAEEIPDESRPERSTSVGDDSLDVPKYLLHYNIPFKTKEEPSRTLYLLTKCLFAGNHTKPDHEGDSSIIQGTDGKLGYQCFHQHCQTRTWADARKKISGDDSLIKFMRGYTEPKASEDHQKKDRGTPRGLFEILDEPDKTQDPLIENLAYPGDKGFTVSMYKIGKTLFQTQQALCLSMAIPFLGMNIPKPRKVLHIRFELKDFRFKKRLEIMLPALGGRNLIQKEPRFLMTRNFDIKRQQDFDWLLKMIYDFEPEVLFLDPFYKLSLSTDLRKDSGSGIIERFDNLMGRFSDLHVSIAHHLRKQTGGVEDNSWDSAYGPMQLFADMDYEIRISRKGHQKDTFKFSHISNDVPVEDFTFKRNPITLLYELESTPDIQAQWIRDSEKIVNRVAAGLNKRGSIYEWMIRELKYPSRDCKDCIDYLIQEKKLEQTGKGSRVILGVMKENDGNSTLFS
jgi:hypothetical protein